jgi:hypothetical protein
VLSRTANAYAVIVLSPPVLLQLPGSAVGGRCNKADGKQEQRRRQARRRKPSSAASTTAKV